MSINTYHYVADKLFLTIQETVKDINKLNAKLDAIEKSKYYTPFQF